MILPVPEQIKSLIRRFWESISRDVDQTVLIFRDTFRFLNR